MNPLLAAKADVGCIHFTEPNEHFNIGETLERIAAAYRGRYQPNDSAEHSHVRFFREHVIADSAFVDTVGFNADFNKDYKGLFVAGQLTTTCPGLYLRIGMAAPGETHISRDLPAIQAIYCIDANGEFPSPTCNVRNMWMLHVDSRNEFERPDSLVSNVHVIDQRGADSLGLIGPLYHAFHGEELVLP